MDSEPVIIIHFACHVQGTIIVDAPTKFNGDQKGKEASAWYCR